MNTKHQKYQILKNVSKFILVALILINFTASLTNDELENSKALFEAMQILG